MEPQGKMLPYVAANWYQIPYLAWLILVLVGPLEQEGSDGVLLKRCALYCLFSFSIICLLVLVFFWCYSLYFAYSTRQQIFSTLFLIVQVIY